MSQVLYKIFSDMFTRRLKQQKLPSAFWRAVILQTLGSRGPRNSHIIMSLIHPHSISTVLWDNLSRHSMVCTKHKEMMPELWVDLQLLSSVSRYKKWVSSCSEDYICINFVYIMPFWVWSGFCSSQNNPSFSLNPDPPTIYYITRHYTKKQGWFHSHHLFWTTFCFQGNTVVYIS